MSSVLMRAMYDYIDENPATTVMGLRDGIREWRVNDMVYCWPTGDGKRAFCIQDVSREFYVSLQKLCTSGAVAVWAASSVDDPFVYHHLSSTVLYKPLKLRVVAAFSC